MEKNAPSAQSTTRPTHEHCEANLNSVALRESTATHPLRHGRLARELSALGEAARDDAAGLGACTFPVLELGGRPGAVVLVLEAVLAGEGDRVEQVAVLVT